MLRKMSAKEFDKHLEKRFKEILDLAFKKGQEYAERTSRLENFHLGAQLCRTTPEKYLLGLVAKHEVALRDFAERLASGSSMNLSEWLEKTGDVTLYMLLLEGLLLERAFNETSEGESENA